MNRNESSTEENQNREKCFQLLKEYVLKEVLHKGRILRVATIVDQYAKFQKANNLQIKGCMHQQKFENEIDNRIGPILNQNHVLNSRSMASISEIDKITLKIAFDICTHHDKHCVSHAAVKF